MPPNPPLLLDTHVWVWFVEGARRLLDVGAVRGIEAAASDNRLYASAMSVWEIGTLLGRRRLTLAQDLGAWVRLAQRSPGLRIVPVDAAIALDSTTLPALRHGDPADRLILATARALSARLVTCDRLLLDYGATGNVLTLDARP